MRRSSLAAIMSELSSHDIAALRASGQSLDASFQIGKNGLTEGVVKELLIWHEREPLVKVRILKGALGDEADTKALATELAEKAGVTLVEVRGHTALFYRPKNRRRTRRG